MFSYFDNNEDSFPMSLDILHRHNAYKRGPSYYFLLLVNLPNADKVNRLENMIN